jgi:hypothetical protein
VSRAPSTLLTSPISQLDFLSRLVFFAAAPIAILFAALLFPVTGALVNVVVVLVVFLGTEAIRSQSMRWPWLRRIFRRELALATFYAARPPRPFLYYVFYPLLLPYWLWNKEARREFFLFKGYTLTSLVILGVSIVVQYFLYWQPELGLSQYLPVVGITLAIEIAFVLMLLMPLATTVIGLYQTRRRKRLVALLVIGLLSASLGLARVARRRDPIVSFMTRERVLLRYKANRKLAEATQLLALRAAWSHWRDLPNAIDKDGKVLGDPLDAAHTALEGFYKIDEAHAFDLWASSQKRPQMLVLYYEARRNRNPIWVAQKSSGEEVKDVKQLPRGAFIAMRHAAE